MCAFPRKAKSPSRFSKAIAEALQQKSHFVILHPATHFKKLLNQSILFLIL